MTDIEKKAYEAYPKEGGKAYHSEFGTIEFDRNAELREGYIKCAEEYESLPKIHGWVYVFDDGYALDYELSEAAEILNGAGFKSGDRVEILIRKVESTKQV